MKETKDTPLSTMIIEEYKKPNKPYVKTNKRLTIIIANLLVLLTIETAYITLLGNDASKFINYMRMY